MGLQAAVSHSRCRLCRKDAFAVAKDDEIKETLKCFRLGNPGCGFHAVAHLADTSVRPGVDTPSEAGRLV